MKQGKGNRVLYRERTVHSKHPLPQHKRWVYALTSLDDQYWNQIDYILCRQRWRSSIQSTKDKTQSWLWLRSWIPPNSDKKHWKPLTVCWNSTTSWLVWFYELSVFDDSVQSWCSLASPDFQANSALIIPALYGQDSRDLVRAPSSQTMTHL